MYITDLTHFLDDKGAIAPMPAPARRLAEFLAGVVAATSSSTAIDGVGTRQCRCIKCKKDSLVAEIADDDAIEWFCESCGHDGRISNWRRSFWDLSPLPTTR
jgi:hypothetical protein